jgi:hypothetical protein
MVIRIDNSTIYLDFHVFDLPGTYGLRIIIGRPIEKILWNVPNGECLELKVG